MSTYNIVYLITNAFNTYIMFKFINIFLNRYEQRIGREIILYIIYFILTSFVYIVLNIPIITLMTNVILLFLITFIHKSKLFKKVLAVVIIIVTMVIIEILVTFLFGKTDFAINSVDRNFTSFIALIINSIISFIVVLSYKSFVNIKNNIEVSIVYWFSILFVPIGSLSLLIILLQSGTVDKLYIIISIVIIFLINTLIFFLYDTINKSYALRLEKDVLTKQNNCYIKQFSTVRKYYDEINKIEHDLKKHLLTIKAYILNTNSDLVVNYIDDIMDIQSISDNNINTGNIIIDGLINLKVHEASIKGITMNNTINVPQKLNILDKDITIILGNLLDNSFNAIEKVGTDKTICIVINYSKSTLFINIQNKYDGIIIYKNGIIISPQAKHDGKGYGLTIIKDSLKKYNGFIEMESEKNLFVTNVMIYDIAPK